MAEKNTSLAALAGVMTRLPQVLVNVTVDKARTDEDALLAAAVAEAEAEPRGRAAGCCCACRARSRWSG